MKKNFKVESYFRILRYGSIFFGILIFSFSLQLFVQNFNIDQNVVSLKKQQSYLSGETYWIKHYYEPYLSSKYSYIIFNHSNGLALDKEIIVKLLKTKQDYNKPDRFNYTAIHNLTWQLFFKKLLDNLQSNLF